MTEHIVNDNVREMTVRAACELLKRVQCDVTTQRTNNGYTITVTMPTASTMDIHNQRLIAAREQTT